jgi:predicted DNA repair protein MutK
MATSLLALLDDITAMTKIAAGKTAGVLGDDLALNAQQVAGVAPDRELPVVWAVAKGSMRNKAILVPAALAISAWAHWAIVPLLMMGGAFLCFEGFEKVFHKLLGHAVEEEVEHLALAEALTDPQQDAGNVMAVERDKIKGAIRTDFILSAEIIVICLGTLAETAWPLRVAVLCVVAVLMTVGVYGLVAGIVKLDDLGLRLSRGDGVAAMVGRGILRAAPWLMTTLTVVGTAAMFLVGGGILAHGIAPVEHLIHGLAQATGWLAGATTLVLHGVVGVVAGAVAVGVVTLVGKLRGS